METLLKMLAGLRYVMGRVNCSQAQDFTLSGRPGIGTVLSGGSIVYTTIVAGTNGFSGTTHLSLSGLPAGAGASFAPSSTNFILQGMRLVVFVS